MDDSNRPGGNGSGPQRAGEQGEDSGDRPPPSPADLTIEVIDATGRLPGTDARWLHAALARACGELGAGGDVRVRVVADEEMARAHERWSGVAGTTDVLTFDLRDADEGPLDLDALVCLDEALRRAEGAGHGPREELLLYALHAVLHGLGYEDQTDEGFAAMHAREDEVLAAIGVGPVFAPRGAGS